MKLYTKVAIAAGGVVTAMLLYWGLLQVNGNFHEVYKGELYRSAQFEPGDITRYAKKYGIRSVLNLRGENTGRDWYNEEVAESKADGITHINFRMSAHTELNQQEAENLIKVMRDAPKPLLIHCQAGSDRTGLASALYVAAIKKDGEEAAEWQLSVVYGHLPIIFARGYAMHQTFEALEPWLGFYDS